MRRIIIEFEKTLQHTTKYIFRDLLRTVSIEEFFSKAPTSCGHGAFLTKHADMVLLLHDRKLSQTFQSLLCNIYLFYYNDISAATINLSRISLMFNEALNMLSNSPEAKMLSPEFNISNWLKDVFSVLDILKGTGFYKPVESESIYTRSSLSMVFTSEETLYFDKLMKLFPDTAKQVGLQSYLQLLI